MLNVKLLIVEDEEIVAFDLESSLHNLGYEVCEVVASGEAALASVATNLPNLILMDIKLQGSMDGIEAAEAIYKLFKIPIIYLTAYGDQSTIERAKLTEPFGYLVKPFAEKELHTTIEIALTRHYAEQRVLQALEKEKELSQMKSLFVANASHEFRTPLATIRSSIDLLTMYCSELMDSKKTKHFQRIQTAIDQMLQLLDDLLLIGKAETGKIAFNPAPLNLVEFCENLVEELQINTSIQYGLNIDNNSLLLKPDNNVLALETSVKIVPLSNDVQPTPKVLKRIAFTHQGNFAQARMDGNLLQQILTNILSNAVKYSPKNEIVNFDLCCEAQIVTIRIQDRGIGIDKEDQPQLFEPFYRAGNVGKIQGTGLGLSIVKKCVELHESQIYVESEVGNGTTFIVKLPLIS